MIEQRVPTVSGIVIEAEGGPLTADERRYVTAVATGLAIREGMPYEMWAGLVGRLVEAEKRVHWYLADLINFGERRYGEMYSQALDAASWSYQTLRDVTWVGRRFELSR